MSSQASLFAMLGREREIIAGIPLNQIVRVVLLVQLGPV